VGKKHTQVHVQKYNLSKLNKTVILQQKIEQALLTSMNATLFSMVNYIRNLHYVEQALL